MEETKSQKRKARRRQHGVPGNHRRNGNKFADETLQSQSGSGLIKVNGQPLSLVQPQILRFKVRTNRIQSPTCFKTHGHHGQNTMGW